MSKFSAQDYNFVAKRLREHFPIGLVTDDPEYRRNKQIVRSTLTILALDFARYYVKDNPSFQPLKFLDACSPDPEAYPLSELWEG